MNITLQPSIKTLTEEFVNIVTEQGWSLVTESGDYIITTEDPFYHTVERACTKLAALSMVHGREIVKTGITVVTDDREEDVYITTETGFYFCTEDGTPLITDDKVTVEIPVAVSHNRPIPIKDVALDVTTVVDIKEWIDETAEKEAYI